MKKSRKVDESKFDFIEEYAKAVEEADKATGDPSDAPAAEPADDVFAAFAKSQAEEKAKNAEKAQGGEKEKGAGKDKNARKAKSGSGDKSGKDARDEAGRNTEAASGTEAESTDTAVNAVTEDGAGTEVAKDSAGGVESAEDKAAASSDEELRIVDADEEIKPAEPDDGERPDASDTCDGDDEDEPDTDSPEYRRMLRHKRRVRNQLIAYISVAVIFAAIGVGVAYASKYVMKEIHHKQQVEQEQAALEEAEAAQEEEVVIEPPETLTPEPEVTEEEPAAEPGEEEVVEVEEDYLGEMVDATISQMPIEDKIAQLFLITPEELTGVNKATKAGDGTREALEKYAVGGLIYSRDNLESEDQVIELLENTRNMSKYEMLFAIREAGGENSVLSGSVLEDIPTVDSPADIAAAGDASGAYNAGVTMASYMSYFGFNMNLAPNASLTVDEGSVSADVSYGADEALAGDMITQMINGLSTGRISACLTDYPGTGSITEDTAGGRVDSELSEEELTSKLVPYITGIASGAQFVQMNNVTYINADPSAMPASLSEYIINKMLRTDMAYDGVVITAPLNDKAITEYYTAGEAALYALAAGADMICMPEDFEAAYEGLMEAAANGNLPESRVDDSLKRIFRVKMASYVE